MQKILIVDDDTAIAELISDALQDEGFETKTCNDGAQALTLIRTGEPFALVILDIMMPKMDGLTLCRMVRDQLACPILFLTAKNNTMDMMLGLELGGDDYLTKPFVVEELIARVKAHLRRERRALQPAKNVLTYGEISINRENYEAYRGDQKVALTTREFQILEYLMLNAGKVLSREQIYNEVWGSPYGDIGSVTVHIKNLRTKLDPDSSYIKTVWGVGYKFAKQGSSEG